MATPTTQFTCSQKTDKYGHNQQNCKYMVGPYTESQCVGMLMAYPQCGLSYNPLCNAQDGAYVPSVTVCIQGLWSF